MKQANINYKAFAAHCEAMERLKGENGVICRDKCGNVAGLVHITSLQIKALEEVEIYARGLDASARKELRMRIESGRVKGSIYTDGDGVRWYMWRDGARVYERKVSDWLRPNRRGHFAQYRDMEAIDIATGQAVVSWRHCDIGPMYNCH